MKKILLLVLFLYAVNFLIAELDDIDPNFYEFGARPMGMGGAFVALADKPSSIIWNPAGLCNIQNLHSFTFDNSNLLDLVNYSFLGYSYKNQENISFGIAMIYCGDDVFSETVLFLSSAINGKFISDNLVRLPSLADRFNFGMNLKYYSHSFGNNNDGSYIDGDGEHQISGSASGFGIDFGLQFMISENDKFGLMWRNPINNILWNSKNDVGTAKGEYSESRPVDLIFGYAFENDKFTFSMDYDKALSSDCEDEIKTGIETKFFNKLLALRAGYSQELFTGENRRFSFGIGFELLKIWRDTTFNFDIAYQIQETHNILRISFDILH